MATAKSAKKASKKSTGTKPAKAYEAKGLQELIEQAMTDKAFNKLLQSDPQAALEQNGYPANERLVKAISGLDFGAFQAFRKKRPSPFFC